MLQDSWLSPKFQVGLPQNLVKGHLYKGKSRLFQSLAVNFLHASSDKIRRNTGSKRPCAHYMTSWRSICRSCLHTKAFGWFSISHSSASHEESCKGTRCTLLSTYHDQDPAEGLLLSWKICSQTMVESSTYSYKLLWTIVLQVQEPS